jgi:hypothetical protein
MPRRAAKINTEGKPWARYMRLSKAEAAEDRDKTPAERMAVTNAKLDAIARSRRPDSLKAVGIVAGNAAAGFGLVAPTF